MAAEFSVAALLPERQGQHPFGAAIPDMANTLIGTAMAWGASKMSFAIALFLAQATTGQGVTLGDLQVRLFYKETGRLSEDVLSRKTEFVFHNTVIGEGDAEEAADDLLVSAVLSAGKFGRPEDNEKFVESPVVIVARDRTGKVIGRRSYPNVLRACLESHA